MKHVRDLVAAVRSRPRLGVALFIGGVVGFAFWESLFAGGSLVPSDLLDAFSPPFNADREFGFVPDRASGDVLNIHSHWTMAGRTFRDGWSWWDSSLGFGYPVMKGGFPIFALPYLVLPAWFAAGALAAARTATAWALTHAWLRTHGLRRTSTVLAGAAYAFSGFLMGWGGWPHANVAALAPGLLWALEMAMRRPSLRRGVPIGVVLALMVWSNFPLVAVYVVLAALMYVGFRLGAEHGRAQLGPAVRGLLWPALVAGVVAMGLAAAHILHFAERLGWGDTSARRFATDSSAGGEFLLTTVAPSAFGSNAHGPAWWGNGNFVEFQIHVGGPVMLVSLVAWAAARGHDPVARRRRGAVLALWTMVVTGAIVGYIGGPVTDILQTAIGDLGGLATRSKIWISLGFAGLCGFGLDAWLDDRADAAAARRQALRPVLGVMAVLGLWLAPAFLDWYDQLVALGHRRDFVEVSVVPIVATLVVAVALWRRGKGSLPMWFVPVVGAALVIELLVFAMPLPTVVSRFDRLEPTAAHAVVADHLEPGERLVGEANLFFPNTTQIFEIDALGGDVLSSPGYQALLAQVNPGIFTAEFGGTPTYPAIPIGTDPTLAVWDALGIGVWATTAHSPLPGPRVEPAASEKWVDPTTHMLRGTVEVPSGGLRAILLDVELFVAAPGSLDVALTRGDTEIVLESRRNEGALGRREVRVFAVDGEHFALGETLEVEVRADGPSGTVLVGVAGASDDLVIGTISGADDGIDVISTGPVTILERLDAAAVRLHDAAVVEPDPEVAAAVVVRRSAVADAPVVVDEAVGLPETPDVDASLVVTSVDRRGDEIEIVVETDRDAVLVVAENHYPGWSATVDGLPAPVLQADAALLATTVPAGRHTVRFTFRPSYLTVSLILFALTTIAGAVLWRGTDDRNSWRGLRRAG